MRDIHQQMLEKIVKDSEPPEYCHQTGDGPWILYKRREDGTYSNEGPCKHTFDHEE